eukprot:4149333-Prymnesium_polylepis.1
MKDRASIERGLPSNAFHRASSPAERDRQPRGEDLRNLVTRPGKRKVPNENDPDRAVAMRRVPARPDCGHMGARAADRTPIRTLVPYCIMMTGRTGVGTHTVTEQTARFVPGGRRISYSTARLDLCHASTCSGSHPLMPGDTTHVSVSRCRHGRA